MKKLLFIVFIFFAIILASVIVFMNKTSTNKFSEKYETFQVIVEEEPVEKGLFSRVDGQYYFSTELITEYLDETVIYDDVRNEVILNNRAGKKELPLDKDFGILNGKKIGLRDPLYKEKGKVFVPIEAFIYDYPVKVRYNKDRNTLVMDYTNKIYASAHPSGDGVNMREGKSTNTPIVRTLNKEDILNVYGEENGWYSVREKTGYAGWIRGDNLEVETLEGEFVKEKQNGSISRMPKPINVTWDYTYAKVKDSVIENIKPIEGLDVIIPTWFSIKNETGDIIDRGDIRYTQAYNRLGIDVWGYVDNQFDKDLTHSFLQNEEGRIQAINKLIQAAKKYGMKGINVDFENTLIEDRDGITLFVKELSEAASKEDLIISVCVTPQISSNVEKEPYDRKELSKYVDYVALMAYDQHWGSSDTAGSVAEYKWVEGNINLSLRQIPQEKFLLGVPFYSRLWKEGASGTKSDPVGMTATKKYIEKNGLTSKWDDQAKQYYIENSVNNKIEKIWIEDADSIQWKTSLVRKYNLAGVASWRLGFETSDIWKTINEEFDHYEYVHK